MLKIFAPPKPTNFMFSAMEKKEKKQKTIIEELDEIIELKKHEASAWKKISDSLKKNISLTGKK